MKFNPTVKLKLISAFGLQCLVILGIGLFSLLMMARLNSQNALFTNLFEADKLLYQARLAQADYMLLEDVTFKDRAINYIAQADKLLTSVKGEMKVDASISSVNDIQYHVNEYKTAFLNYSDAKNKDIAGRTEFIERGDIIISKIDNILRSIENFFSQNQNDFEEFSRYIAASEMKHKFNDLRIAIWQFNTKATPERQQAIDNQTQSILLLVPQLKTMMKSPDTQRLLDELQSDLKQYVNIKVNVLEAHNALERTQSNMLSSANKATELAFDLRLKEAEIAKSVNVSTEISIGVGIVMSVILSSIMAFLLIRSIMTPLTKSIRFAQEVSNGNLTSSIAVKGDDEFSRLNTALNESVTSLRSTITEIITVFSSLSTMNNYVEKTVAETNQSMQTQLVENEALAVAINQSSNAIREITQNANNASSESLTASEATKLGNSVVTEATDAMQQLAGEMNTAGGYVNKLNDDVTSINDILSVITSIADQTNLLALNAAIEAARAGEQGRGFAVVADEVRTLAQKTQNSIEEITAIIDVLKSGASNVVNVMDKSINKTQMVLELTEKASDAYASISNAVETITKLNSSVSQDADMQSKIFEEINNNSEKIKSIAVSNGEKLNTIKDQTNEQTQQVVAVQKLIEFFKVS